MNRLVRLPEGGRIEIELDAEQVEVFVRAAIDRHVKQRVGNVMLHSELRSLIKSYAREWVHNALEVSLSPTEEGERPHDAFERAVKKWLEAREGWVAKVLRRGAKKVML